MDRPLPTRAAHDLERRRRQLKRFFPGMPLAVRLEVLPDLGLLYVRNPKVASSTLLSWLDSMNSGHERDASRSARRDNSLPRPRELGWDRVMRMVDGEAFRFSFVRDPVTRFESAYRSKILKPTQSRRQVFEALGRAEDQGDEITFEEFLRAVEQQAPLEMDIHWRPQHLMLMHPVFTFDMLGRLERFDEDIDELRRRLDLPRLPVHSRNVRRDDRPSAYEGRPDLVERVRAIYAQDLELYGY